MKKNLCSIILSLSAAAALAGPSILDIKHSLTDDNAVPPESFETKAIELEEGFYLRNFSAAPASSNVTLGTAEEYERRLSQMPVEIEMPYNDVVGKFIDMYLGRRSNLVSDMLALHAYYGNTFVEELDKLGLPLELQYLPVIESAINPNAVSRAGATGLWQFMPGTAKGLGMEVNTLVDQRRDPRVSSEYAAKYLKQLYDMYEDWPLAIAAYNCGPGNVNKAIKRAGGGNGVKKDFWEIYNYLPKETSSYVPCFIAANYVMNYYDKHGISPRVVTQPLVTDTVMVSDRVHFNQIAAVLNIPVEEIRMLNPQFRKDIIPGNNHPYALTLPATQILSYVMSEPEIIEYDKELYAQRTFVEPGQQNNEASAPAATQPDVAQTENAETNNEIATLDLASPTRITHTVQRGENIGDIAKKYNVSANDIKRWNNLRRAKVKEGDELIIEVYDNPVSVPAAATASNPAPDGSSSETAADAPVVPGPAGSVAVDPADGNQDNVVTAQTTASNNSGSTTTSNKKKNNTPTYTTITVQSGDNLTKIASRYGTTVSNLKKINNLKSDNIQIGQKLKVPNSSGSKSSGKSKKSKRRRR